MYRVKSLVREGKFSGLGGSLYKGFRRKSIGIAKASVRGTAGRSNCNGKDGECGDERWLETGWTAGMDARMTGKVAGLGWRGGRGLRAVGAGQRAGQWVW